MNPAPPALTPLPRSARWPWVLLVLTVLCGLLVYGLTGYFRLSRDAAILRDTLRQGAGAAYAKKIELNVGRLTCLVARGVVGCFPMPPEARQALRVVRGAEVGVYELSRHESPRPNGNVLATADAAMKRRGWERVVGVVDRHDLVAVYVPTDLTSPQQARACVMVWSGRQMVVVSARGDLQPLLDLASHQLRAHFPLRSQLAEPRLQAGL